MNMREKITMMFILFALIPIIVIYAVACVLFMNSAKENMEKIYAAHIKEVSKNASGYFQDALDLTLYPIMETNLKLFLMTDTAVPNYQTLKQQASTILLTMPFGSTTGIHGFTIYNESGDSISTLASVKLSQEEKAALIVLNGSPLWDFSEYQKKNGYFYLSRLLKNPNDLSTPVGYIKVAISINEIRNTIRNLQQDPQTSYYVTDEKDTTLISVAATQKGNNTQINHITSCHPITNTPLLIYSTSNAPTLSLIKNAFTSTLFILAILLLIFTIILSNSFSLMITKPLYLLGLNMTSVSNEDFSVRNPVTGTDEISVLATCFNHMTERLEFLYHEVYMGEIRLKHSQLDTLQTQINPHFLYNTLDTIYWMAQMKNHEKVSIMVSNMSRMMRLTLCPATDGMQTLFQELEHVNCYLTIQKIRYGNKFTFEINCPDYLKNYKVLCFLIQPLIENALIHGLSNRLSGIVKIDIFEKSGDIIYEVCNNGEPICIEKLDSFIADKNCRQEKGMALRNINDRLTLKYGADHSLSYYERDGFSIFCICQPMEEQDDKNNDCG